MVSYPGTADTLQPHEPCQEPICPGTSVARVLPVGLEVLLLVLVGCFPPTGPNLSWCIGDRPETQLWAADTTCKELTRVRNQSQTQS